MIEYALSLFDVVAHPEDPQDNVPVLLRRVADSIDRMGPLDVHDLVLHTEVTEDGDWHSITVYFHRRRDLRAIT